MAPFQCPLWAQKRTFDFVGRLKTLMTIDVRECTFAIVIKDVAINEIINLRRGGVSESGWAGCVRREDVERWSVVGKTDVASAFDIVAVEIAKNYAAEIFTWDFCESVVNELFSVLTEFQSSEEGFDTPSKFWEVYLAFDDSEDAALEAEIEQVARRNIDEFLMKLETG